MKGKFGDNSQAFKKHETGSNPQKYSLFDSGATAHFLVKGASVVNEQVATNSLHVKLPDGTYMVSSHTCNLNIPWLPSNITEAHIVP